MTQPNWFIGLPVDARGWFPERLGAVPEGVRLFAPEDLHATVAFLGGCGEVAARRAWEALAPLPRGGFQVRLGEVVPMGPPRRWSALSALASAGRAEVEAWIGAARGPCWEAAGARPDRRAAKFHVTVARPQRRASEAERQAARAWAERLELGAPEIRLDRVALYTWADDRRARLFRVIAEAHAPA